MNADIEADFALFLSQKLPVGFKFIYAMAVIKCIKAYDSKTRNLYLNLFKDLLPLLNKEQSTELEDALNNFRVV